MNRYRDWLTQAKENLNHAEHSAKIGDYAWACFAAQQAAEMATKGLHMKMGQIAWGHSLLELLESLPENVKPQQDFLEKAKILDKYYIPTRYPNAHPAGPAYRHYTKKEAREAINLAEEVLEYCECKSMED
ncbi:MAG TPA: HEPN domain-containing protein [Candidatus Omnitrophica bacterium]|nr:HEPN domain-containing protein [Candidatus Omnitrophota bacterium]